MADQQRYHVPLRMKDEFIFGQPRIISDLNFEGIWNIRPNTIPNIILYVFLQVFQHHSKYSSPCYSRSFLQCSDIFCMYKSKYYCNLTYVQVQLCTGPALYKSIVCANPPTHPFQLSYLQDLLYVQVHQGYVQVMRMCTLPTHPLQLSYVQVLLCT